MFYKYLKLLQRPQRSVDIRTARLRQGSNMQKKRRYPSDISSFSYFFESTRRRRTSGGRSPATTGVERRHSNRSNPAGLEHRKKSHPMDGSFFYVQALPGSNGSKYRLRSVHRRRHHVRSKLVCFFRKNKQLLIFVL